jgi:hypothetical protein
MVKVIKNLKQKEKRLLFLKDTTLALCLFFNPFGFDVVQYYLLTLTGNIWRANFVLYCIAGLFFGCYIYLSKKVSKKSQ